MGQSHDRRFFDPLLKLSLVAILVSFGILIFYSWKLGLAAVLLSCISFITLESISAPPANRPSIFIPWSRRQQQQRRPVLLCFGDGLTHGNCSASFTPEIPAKLCAKLGMDPPRYGLTFADPLWVVNAGQNGITSHTILRERLNHALGCYPDFVCVWIGMNDVRAMYSSVWAREVVGTNGLAEVPTLANFQRNLSQIIQFIRQASPMVRVAVCTLPPMGENLRSSANQWIRQANDVIEQVVATSGDEKVCVIPIFANMESALEKKRSRFSMPPEAFPFLMTLMCPLYHMMGTIFSWNVLSSLTGGMYLWDGIHLNERGADLVADLIVEWLMNVHVAKAIAVKCS